MMTMNCVLDCDDFRHYTFRGLKDCDENKGLGKWKGDNHERFSNEYEIRFCDDEEFVENYVYGDDMNEYDHVGAYNHPVSTIGDDLEARLSDLGCV